MKTLFFSVIIILLCGGCTEFRELFSRPSRKPGYRRKTDPEESGKKRSPYRHPMDEWIFGSKKQRQEFAGALSETERQEWNKFRQSSGDTVFDEEVRAVHQSLYDRKRKNEEWVYNPRPDNQD